MPCRRRTGEFFVRFAAGCGLVGPMAAETTQSRNRDPVVQFSVFTPNRLGRLRDLIGVLGSHGVHVLALAVLDTTDSAIIRLVADDPEKAEYFVRVAWLERQSGCRRSRTCHRRRVGWTAGRRGPDCLRRTGGQNLGAVGDGEVSALRATTPA